MFLWLRIPLGHDFLSSGFVQKTQYWALIASDSEPWFCALWTMKSACTFQIRSSLRPWDPEGYRLRIFSTSLMETTPRSDIKPYGGLLAVYTNPPVIHSRRHSLCSFSLFSLLVCLLLVPDIRSRHAKTLSSARCSSLLPSPTIAKPVSGWDPLSAWKHSVSLGISCSCSKCLARLSCLCRCHRTIQPGMVSSSFPSGCTSTLFPFSVLQFMMCLLLPSCTANAQPPYPQWAVLRSTASAWEYLLFPVCFICMKECANDVVTWIWFRMPAFLMCVLRSAYGFKSIRYLTTRGLVPSWLG